MENDYCFYHIGKTGSPLLVFEGYLDIDPRPFKDIIAGDKISRVGGEPKTGVGSGMASLNRNAAFDPYITYRGIAHISEFDNDPLLIFEIRDEDKPKGMPCPMYCAWIILDVEGTETELKLWDHPNNTVWIARPVFTKYTE